MKFADIKYNLVEARADYNNLFNPIVAIAKKNNILPNIDTIVNSEISKAKQNTGTRYNYMMYYLKLFRSYLAQRMLTTISDIEDRKKLSTIINTSPKYNISNETITKPNLDKVLTDFKHYLSYNFKPIEDYIPIKPFMDVLDDLSNLETEYQEKNVDDETRFLQLQDGDEIIKVYPDGFAWILLSRHYCREEADAMGHCGNAGGSRTDRIISLRKKEVKNGETYYIPYLTFIYNPKTKLLGERKARFNEKPSKRYHPYIIDLLRMDMIQGMESEASQYAPENNFQYDDLTPEQLDRLLKDKPILSVTEGAKLADFTDEIKDTIASRIKSREGIAELFYDKEKNKIYTTLYPESFLDSNLIKFLNDPTRYMDFSYLYNYDYIDNYSSLNMENTEKLYNAIKKAVENDVEDFPDLSRFNKAISRGNLLSFIENDLDIDIDNNAEMSEIVSNLQSILVGTAESEYETMINKSLMNKMPEFGNYKFTFEFKGFANKNYRGNKKITNYYSYNTYYAVYVTDRLVLSSDIVEELVQEDVKQLDMHDLENGWYPDFNNLNETFSELFEY